ncbi:hypothetical protein ACFX2F_046660 [Malus domestica]
MASKKGQAVLATKGKSLNTPALSGEFIGVTTRSKAKAIATVQHAIPKLVPLKEQGEHQKREPVITLASLLAPREESSKKYSESLLSDVDSSSNLAMQVMTT